MENTMTIQFKNSTQRTVIIGVCTALIIVLSQLSIPMPNNVPITFQTLAIALCGYILGSKFSAIATFLYVVMGAIGLPVFANFSGGFGSVVGFTGGFIWGFIFMAFICGIGCRFENKFISIGFGVLGLLVCDICGAFQYALIAGINFFASFMLVAVPYLIKDIICVVIAYTVSVLIVSALKKSNLVKT